MLKCAPDPSIERLITHSFAMPLGVKPIEPVKPAAGYLVDFEPADGDETEGDWEAWPDRYVFEATISATRLPALCRMLFSLLPGRVYPILDFLGHDAYREIDPYIAYEPVGLDQFYEGVSWFAPFLYDDGLCGFGAMCDQPFIYIFVDEHKVLTLRIESGADGQGRDRIERILSAFGLSEIEAPSGADAAAHEHRSVLLSPADRPELHSAEEIVETLRDLWRLTLNVDSEMNLDDAGVELGITNWRCLIRCFPDDTTEAKGPIMPRYAEILLQAPCLGQAEEMAALKAETMAESEKLVVEMVVAADRLTQPEMNELLSKHGQSADSPPQERIFIARWLE